MCRLLGIYGRVDGWRNIAEAFRQLAETGKIPPGSHLTAGHKDGWGMAAADHSTMRVAAREMGSALDSALYSQTLAKTHSPEIFFCHLRKASPAVAISPANVHPFFIAPWAFAHNGTVFDAQDLPRDPQLQSVSENSDTEHLFHYLLTHLADAPRETETAKILAQALSKLDPEKYTSLSSFLSDGRRMYAMRWHSRYQDYYTLYYQKLARGVVICSEPLDVPLLKPAHWKLMENRTVLAISDEEARIETVSVA